MPLANSALLTHDDGRGRTVMLGTADGALGGPLHAEWDGVDWRRLPVPPTGPQALYLHAQAFDAARGETVVFGGSLGNNGLGPVVGATHAWNGTSWRLAATSGPAPRRGAAMTYDSARQRVVLCGGRNPAAQSSLLDHWEWDGIGWTQMPAVTPFAGWATILGFDPVRQRVVGHDLQQRTLEYDGTSWTVAASGGPILEYGADPGDPWHLMVQLPSFAWDAASQRLVANMRVGSAVVPFGWNGVDWQSLPLPVGLHTAVAGSSSLLAASAAGLELVSDQPAATAAYGLGCGGSTTGTSLAAFGRPVLGSSAFHLDLRAEARLAVAAFGFGDAAVNAPLGNGCTLYVGGLFAVEARLMDASGFVRLPLPIPASQALVGAALVAQGLVFDPLSPGGLALSPGRTLTLGD
jgi:hypothetical protein